MGGAVPQAMDRLRALLSAVPDDLALPQLRALVAIAAEPGLSVSDLAERVGVPQQTASRYVAVLLGRYQDALEHGRQRVLVEQRISEEDPRRRALFLSDEGTNLLSSIINAAFSGLQN